MGNFNVMNNDHKNVLSLKDENNDTRFTFKLQDNETYTWVRT